MTATKRRFALGIVESLMLAVAVAVLAFLAGEYRTRAELDPFMRSNAAGDEIGVLQRQYGAAHESEHAEEWIVRDFFKDARDGVFVDVGANDYRRFSNTYYLETALGWSGLAIEPQVKFAAGYAAHRPRTTFLPLFVSDRSNEHVALNVGENDLTASSDKTFAKSFGDHITAVTTTTTTLDDVLASHHLAKIDFLTMDIELAEPAALRGFSIRQVRPRLVCIEAHMAVRQQILEYFAKAGYDIVGKYLRADDANLWFTPRD
jgi:FkbM family methyltransferase